MHLKHLDLFSGVGMFSLAARWAVIETIAFSEIDPRASATFTHQFPGLRNLGDVRKLCRRAGDCDASEYDTHGIVWCPLCDEEFGDCACIGSDQFLDEHGAPDIITAGSPCQGFSTAGKGAGLDDPRSALITEPLRIADELRPAFLFFENVPALKSRGAETILSALDRRGYRAQTFVVGASHVGGEHRRKRAWIVAYDTTQRIQGLRPERQSLSHTLAPALLPLRDRHGQWQVEPDIRRVPHGDARWMDRVACIGNALVPQIPVHFFDWMREVTQADLLLKQPLDVGPE